jgi:prepilin-type N-terminal cleavage/methylation domain-containing protein
MKRPPHSHRSSAFTLIELLTVIAIIGILMTLLFPMIGSAREQARKADAKQACTLIKTAILSYQQEEGRFPVDDQLTPPQGSGTDSYVIFGDPALISGATPNNVLFNVLRGIPDQFANKGDILNKKKRSYMDSKLGSGSGTNCKGGFADGNKFSDSIQGAFFDPWGYQFAAAMDYDGNNFIDLGKYYPSDFGGSSKENSGNAPRQEAVAFSLGKDGKLGDNGNRIYKEPNKPPNDVVSWQ